jgi:transcriptional regulator with XRE-family HTH domain
MATVVQKFGAKIKKLRTERKLTQEALSEKVGIDYSYMNLIENGKRNPSLKIIAKIARILGVGLDDLMKLK